MKGIANIASLALLVMLDRSPCTTRAAADVIYLSTFYDDTVLKLDAGGNKSIYATSDSGLDYPVGLVTDNYGNLYVANAGNNTIEQFTQTGIGTVFTNPSAGEYFALASDGRGDLYVSDIGDNTVYKYSPGGAESVFASGLAAPDAITCDTNGNLYVANAGNNTIVEFSPDSGTGSVFATAASGVRNPQAIAFDSNGNLYVANYGDNSIERFNALGQGSVFTSTNLLDEPVGLAFDSGGDLYVANLGDGDILKFNTNAIGSVFCSGLGDMGDITIEVPEPSSLAPPHPRLFPPRILRSPSPPMTMLYNPHYEVGYV